MSDTESISGEITTGRQRRDEAEQARLARRQEYEARPFAQTEQMLQDLALQWGRVESNTYLETSVGGEELPTIYVPHKITFDSLSRLRVFASKAAMLFNSSEAEEQAERRLSIIQDAADGGVISFGFDIDGGVHATVFEAGGDTLAVRNAEGIREALDALGRGEGVYADNDKANGGVFLERQDMDILSRIHHAHANMLQALGAVEWHDTTKLAYWTEQFNHFRNLYSRLHKKLGAGPDTTRELNEAMDKKPEPHRCNPLRLANAARMVQALMDAKYRQWNDPTEGRDLATAQTRHEQLIDFLAQNLRSDDPEGGHIEIDFKSTAAPQPSAAERSEAFIASLGMQKTDEVPDGATPVSWGSELFTMNTEGTKTGRVSGAEPRTSNVPKSPDAPEWVKGDVAMAAAPQHYGVNPWVPMTDPVDVKHMLKAQEELGECQSAVARCQMQGIDESEPVTGKVNRVWLMDEVADVFATLEMLQDRFGLDKAYIRNRAEYKKVKLAEWHAMAGGKSYTYTQSTSRTVIDLRPPMPKEGSSNYEASLLRNLLAVIYGDGGQYVQARGIDAASEDAERLWLELRNHKQVLADTLGKVIMASGMLRKDIDGLTGPQLVQFGEELAEAIRRMDSRRNTPTHEHLSTMLGLLMSVKHGRLKDWKDGSVIAKSIHAAVDHMKDWPYPEEVGTVAIDSVLEEAEAGLEVAVGRLKKDGKARGDFKTSEELALGIVKDARSLLAGGEHNAYALRNALLFHSHSVLLNAILRKMEADLGRTPDPTTMMLDVNVRELTEEYFAQWDKTRITSATRFGVVMPPDIAADYKAMNARTKRSPWNQSIVELNFKLNRQGNGGPTEREAIRLVNAVVDHLGLRAPETKPATTGE